MTVRKILINKSVDVKSNGSGTDPELPDLGLTQHPVGGGLGVRISSPIINAEITARAIGDMMRVEAEQLPGLVRLMERYLGIFEVSADSIAGDFLFGAQEIAAFMGLNRRDIYHLMEKSSIPIAQPNDGRYVGRKSALLCWHIALELKSFRRSPL